MKSINKIGILCAFSGGLLLSACESSRYVATQPAAVVYTRPVAPYAGAIWVEGNWVRRGGKWKQQPGYWIKPHPGRTWVQGRWYKYPKGNRWQKGYWR
jgi:hypothetical protein